MPVRLVGSNDHQSPSSMKPMFWKPPAVSPVVSALHAGVAAADAAGARPVAVKYSACLRLGCRLLDGPAGQRAGAAGAAVVGVGGLEDREDVGLGAVPGGQRGLDGAGAAGVLLQRVGVLVVAEVVLQRHAGAVDRAVLRVGHGDRVLDLVAPVEEAAVRRELDA